MTYIINLHIIPKKKTLTYDLVVSFIIDFRNQIKMTFFFVNFDW